MVISYFLSCVHWIIFWIVKKFRCKSFKIIATSQWIQFTYIRYLLEIYSSRASKTLGSYFSTPIVLKRLLKICELSSNSVDMSISFLICTVLTLDVAYQQNERWKEKFQASSLLLPASIAQNPLSLMLRHCCNISRTGLRLVRSFSSKDVENLNQR